MICITENNNTKKENLKIKYYLPEVDCKNDDKRAYKNNFTSKLMYDVQNRIDNHPHVIPYSNSNSSIQ